MKNKNFLALFVILPFVQFTVLFANGEFGHFSEHFKTKNQQFQTTSNPIIIWKTPSKKYTTIDYSNYFITISVTSPSSITNAKLYINDQLWTGENLRIEANSKERYLINSNIKIPVIDKFVQLRLEVSNNSGNSISSCYLKATNKRPKPLDKTNKTSNEDKYDSRESEFFVLPKYREARPYYEGLALVRDRGFGFIDKKGEIVIPIQYDIAYSFSNGLALVNKDRKYGFIDKFGQTVIPLKYRFAQSFSEGLAPVTMKNKYGYIDKTGKEVIPFIYDAAYGFSEGLAVVRKGKRWGYINKSGKIVIPLKYAHIPYSFSEGLAFTPEGFINKSGKVVIPHYIGNLNFDRRKGGYFYKGIAVMKTYDEKYGFIDKKGKIIIPFIYEDGYSFSEGLASVKLNGKWGFIDKTGKTVIPFEYDLALPFSEGLANVHTEPDENYRKEFNKYEYIDKEGNVVIKNVKGGLFRQGRAPASILRSRYNKYGFMKHPFPDRIKQQDSEEGMLSIDRTIKGKKQTKQYKLIGSSFLEIDRTIPVKESKEAGSIEIPYNLEKITLLKFHTEDLTEFNFRIGNLYWGYNEIRGMKIPKGLYLYERKKSNSKRKVLFQNQFKIEKKNGKYKIELAFDNKNGKIIYLVNDKIIFKIKDKMVIKHLKKLSKDRNGNLIIMTKGWMDTRVFLTNELAPNNLYEIGIEQAKKLNTIFLEKYVLANRNAKNHATARKMLDEVLAIKNCPSPYLPIDIDMNTNEEILLCYHGFLKTYPSGNFTENMTHEFEALKQEFILFQIKNEASYKQDQLKALTTAFENCLYVFDDLEKEIIISKISQLKLIKQQKLAYQRKAKARGTILKSELQWLEEGLSNKPLTCPECKENYYTRSVQLGLKMASGGDFSNTKVISRHMDEIAMFVFIAAKSSRNQYDLGDDEGIRRAMAHSAASEIYFSFKNKLNTPVGDLFWKKLSEKFGMIYSPGSFTLNSLKKYVTFPPLKDYMKRPAYNRLAAELNGETVQKDKKSEWRDDDNFVIDDLIKLAQAATTVGLVESLANPKPAPSSSGDLPLDYNSSEEPLSNSKPSPSNKPPSISNQGKVGEGRIDGLTMCYDEGIKYQIKFSDGKEITYWHVTKIDCWKNWITRGNLGGMITKKTQEEIIEAAIREKY